ncbi:S6 family peptidase [Escherichia coli]|uniref:S6 family peptidase n=1 Tax=Escherichia coli TaxID=562 RepID=UPI002FE14E28
MNKIYKLKFSKLANCLIAVPEFCTRGKSKISAQMSLLSILVIISFNVANASTVSSLIDYQVFRDFAENKGVFKPGAEDISIYKKDGSVAGILNKAPMPDFKSVDRSGIATLVNPQYVVSVKHNVGYQSVVFGSSGNNPDANNYNYKLVDRNDHDRLDFHAPRLNKIVTEVAPSEITEQGAKDGAYADKNRYPVFYRIGSGTQRIKDPDNKLTWLSGAYNYLTGGTVYSPSSYQHGEMITSRTGDTFSATQGPLASYGEAGDSGSPLFGYDSKLDKWVLVGVLTAGNGAGCCANNWAVIPTEWLENTINSDKDQDIIYEKDKGKMIWSFDKDTGIGTLRQDSVIYNMHGNKGASDLNAGKDLIFTGDSGEIVLDDSVNQGAGSLTFNSDFVVSTKNNSTWVGSGIILNKDVNVLWQVNGQKGDALHKIGEGTLHVKGTGRNEGDLRVGDGLVILDQQKDDDGVVQAFNKVTITSGRPTVVLRDAEQVNADNIYFGFRGGRLDLNGNSISLSRIKAVDNGAMIVNHNADKAARITLTGNGMNNYNTDQAYLGFLGERDNNLTNGELNIHYNPPSDKGVLALTGGANVNGSLNVDNGNILISGAPVLHAGNTYLNDWAPSDFVFSNINVADGKGLQIGQYASVATNINAGENSHLLIGYNRGNESWENTRKCTVDDNSGVTNCSQPILSDEELAALPHSILAGDIHLDKNATLTLGKALYTGAVKAATESTFSMASNSKWIMSSNSTTGTLKMASGASIVLSDSTQNNVLNVMGDLEGEGEFELNTRLAEQSGDSIVVHGLASGSYTLKVKGNGGDPVQDGKMQALMSFNNSQQDFSLVNVALAGGYADIGTYRYRLTRQGNDYMLYNPVIPWQPLEPAKPNPDTPETNPDTPETNPDTPEQPVPEVMPNNSQANWISKGSNTAISNFTSHFNLLNQQVENTDRHLTNLIPNESGLWVSYNAVDLHYGNNSYRGYRQKMINQSLGIDRQLEMFDGTLQWGGVLSTTVSHGNFDEGARSNDSMTGVNLYGKWTLNNGGWIYGYSGIHYSDYKLKDQKTVARSGQYNYIAGFSAGYDWNGPGNIKLKPEIGMTFYGLPSGGYDLNDNIRVKEKRSQIVQYRTGVRLSKDIEFSGVNASPFARISHKINANSERNIIINGNQLDANLTNTQTELRLGSEFKIGNSIKLGFDGGYTSGGGLKGSKDISLSFRYNF